MMIATLAGMLVVVFAAMLGATVGTFITLRLWFAKPARQMFLKWRMQKEIRDAGYNDRTAARPSSDAATARKTKARMSGKRGVRRMQ